MTQELNYKTSQQTGDFRAHHPTVPTALPRRLPIPNPNLTLKLTLTLTLFLTLTQPFFGKKQKRHRNISQHRVIFTGYFTN